MSNEWESPRAHRDRRLSIRNTWLAIVIVALITIVYSIAAQPERPWRPSDVRVEDLRGAAKYQAREGLK